MRYTKTPQDTFKNIVVNAGILCKSFNESTGEASDIVAATSGGLTFKATPSFSDWGDDIDNLPANTKELKRLESWEAKASGTVVTFTHENTKRLLAAADVVGNKIVPRDHLEDDDFEDIWIVGDYSEYNGETKGGFVAIHLMNTLSTGGFELKTANKGKSTSSIELTAHYSIADVTKIPFDVYIQEGTEESA